MDGTVIVELPAAEAEQIQAQVRELIEEMNRANERIRKDQEEMDRLKAKTRATLFELADLKTL